MNIKTNIKRSLLLVPVFLFCSLFISMQPDSDWMPGFKAEPVMVLAQESAHDAAPAHGEAVIHGEEAAAAHGEEAAAGAHGEEHGAEAHAEGGHHGPIEMSNFWIIPFVLILLSIAIIPLINGHWWHHNFPLVSLALGLPMAIAMFFAYDGGLQTKTIHTAVEYCSFIALVGSLFVISGGILIRGSFKSSPVVNVVFLAVGAVIASFIGTAGASMVLIRPMLRINRNRKTKVHIFVFFIFMVSNIGGSLTPLGDPPLFLGFLQGVPFTWTLVNMLPAWAFMIGILLFLFFLIDSFMVKREGGVKASENQNKFKIEGVVNFIFLGGVLATVIAYGSLMPKEWALGRDAIQVISMALMAALSLLITPKALREENGFTWFPVKEVAILFAAIFACMIPALNILEYMGSTGKLVVEHPWQFFWMAGILSSFLDNAPTYLTFLSLAKTMGGDTCQAVVGGCVPQQILLAISMGAVFMGANTYIGNAPNFMVKSICEENDVKMPSFIGYMGWSIAILIPLFVIISFMLPTFSRILGL